MNRLSDSDSPYLLQHAENPVDWFPWGDDAFDRAKVEDKPVLVSIGYSACHWCHVMAHESFENPTTAQLMNDHFVNVKVDREERPDVDSVYMEAVQALTGQGGWPLNVFVTPDRKPFFGGTYFPPNHRHGMPSWPQVLHSIAVAWRDNRSDLQRQASALLAHLQQPSSFTPEAPELAPAALDSAFDSLRANFDWDHGGFGNGPKFPNVLIMQFLLRYWARTGNPEPLRMVKLSLERMAAGGLRDHVGGGFHRYTVDRAWVVPHFEKMLYDNALLARIYTEAWQATRSERYRRAATETLDYLLRDMRTPEGTFYSAEDADSDGAEGRFYVWSPEEIDAVLPGSAASLVRKRYGITDQGNFESLNIPNLSADLESLATSAGISVNDLEIVLIESLEKLRNARAARTRPSLDTKVLTDWNALVISSLAFAGHAFRRPDYLDSATKAAEALRARAWVDVSSDGMPMLRHLTSNKPGHVDGFLADYAFLLEAVLTLFESTGESQWIDWASSLSREIMNRFSDGSGSFHFVTETASDLPTQPRDIADGVVPSGTTAALMGLLRLARITGDSSFDRIIQAGLMKLSGIMGRYALSFGHGLGALDLYLSEPIELVVVKADEDSNSDLEALAAACYLPNLIRISVPYRSVVSSSLSLLAGKAIDPQRSYAFLCEHGSCRAPVSDLSSLRRQLEPLLPSSGPD